VINWKYWWLAIAMIALGAWLDDLTALVALWIGAGFALALALYPDNPYSDDRD